MIRGHSSSGQGSSGSRERLELLIVSSDTFPPQRVDVRVLFGEQIPLRGHRVDWILQSEAACNRAYETQWDGGRAWVGPTDLGNSLFSRIRKHVRSIWHDRKLLSALSARRYDIVIVKDKFVSGLLALFASRIWSSRFVYWLSWPFPEDYLLRAGDGTARFPFLYWIRGHTFRVLLYRILLPAADGVLAQSEQMRRDLHARGIRLDKIAAVPMGVKVAGSAPPTATSPSPIPADEPSIVYLGTLIRLRRLDFLIRVLAVVRRSVPEAKLYLVGRGDDPADEQLLIDETARLGLQSAVVFTGQLPQQEAFDYVRGAAVCVSPFYPTPILNSTSPTKLVEYMAMGRPVVANDHPEQKLVIEQSGGGLCVPYDEAEFAAAVVRLLNDPATAADMGRRGQQYAYRHRSYSAIADNVETVLRELVTTGSVG